MSSDFLETEYGRISAGFKHSKLSDLCVDKDGVQTGPFGTQLHNEDYVDIGTPIITVEHLGENRILHSDAPLVSDDDKKRLSKYQLIEGDIVFSRVGSVDRRALVRAAENGWLFSGRCLRVRTDKKKIDPTFLSYFFGLDSFKNYVRGIAVGATMPSINTKILSDLPIYFPENLDVQKKIGKILSSFDDKIELNRKTNQTLEQIAQALFKSWFVDFEPTHAKIAAKEAGASPEEIERAAMCAISGKTPDQLAHLPLETQQNLKNTAALFPDALGDSELGEVPEGWEVTAMGKYVEIKRGGSPRPIQDFMAETGFPWTKISDATAEASPFLFRTKEFIKEEGLKKTVLLKKGTLILSNSATPGLPKFLELDACIHDGWLYFPSKSHFSDIYLFHLFLVLKESFISQGNGSIFTNLKTDILRNQTIVIPPLQLLHAFESIVERT